MDKETLEALKGSIAHWERVVADPKKTRVGASECPLCEMFNLFTQTAKTACAGCPVRAKSKRAWCRGTPFIEFTAVPPNRRTKRAAKAELSFLRSLLPTEDTQG